MPYSPCYLCHAPTTVHSDFCLPCLAAMPWNSNSCHRCALPMTESYSGICRLCSATPPAFDHCHASFTYASPINHMLNRYKQHSDEVTGAILIRLVIQSLPLDTIKAFADALLVPVPMHSQDLRQRGFNQSQQLARALAQSYKLSLDHNLKVMRRHLAQKHLSAHQRKQNMAGVFRYEGKAPKHCVIIDDVMTTGTTANVIAEELKQQGSDQISVVCLARTPAPC